MSDPSSPIRRRRRSKPQPIAEGERKSVTFMADAATYNLMVKASNATGTTISEVIEAHLRRNLGNYLRPKLEDVLFGTERSLHLLKYYAMILAAYDESTDWRDHEPSQAGIQAAMTAINSRMFSLDTRTFGPRADLSDPRVRELNSAWAAGAQLGYLLAGPLSPVDPPQFEDEGSGAEKKAGKS